MERKRKVRPIVPDRDENFIWRGDGTPFTQSLLGPRRRLHYDSSVPRSLIPTTRLQNPQHTKPRPWTSNSIPTANQRDFRLDLFLGIANWFIFLDHIPDDLVNRITIRNYGFSGAADPFVFISGYIAAILYAQDDAGTRLHCRRHADLQARLATLRRLYRAVRHLHRHHRRRRDTIRRARHHHEFNVTGLVDHPIRTVGHGLVLQSKALNLDVLQLYIALMACFAPGAVGHAAQARPRHGRIRCAVSCRASVRMEFVVLPGRQLVLQSVLLAAAFRAGRVVRARRRQTTAADSRIADPGLSGGRLSGVCTCHDHGRAFPGIRQACFRNGCSTPSFPTTRQISRRIACCIFSCWHFS